MPTAPTADLPSQVLIDRYQLQPHPEGGWYRELHRSHTVVTRADGSERSGFTAILFLLEAGNASAWHRVHGADESWHFIAGAPVELQLRSDHASQSQPQLLGFSVERAELQPLVVVPAGWWQAARSLGAWSLVSCCVGPGFDFADFEIHCS